MEKRATPQEFGVVPSGFLYRLVSELFKMVMEAMAHRHRLINIYICKSVLYLLITKHGNFPNIFLRDFHYQLRCTSRL